jgi:hypothetical protein
MEQNYLLIKNNVVENIIILDENSNWTPPNDSIILSQNDTYAMVWILNSDKTLYELKTVLGAGCIGFTWDGSILKTNDPQPTIPIQPTTTGTQTI